MNTIQRVLSILRESCRGVCIKRLTNGSGVRRGEHRYHLAFTLIELVIVIAIIIVLASLILGTSTYLQMKAKRSRAEVEIAALSAALESYKADNGTYPRDTAITDHLDARISGDPATYQSTSLFLYTQLSGTNPDRSSIPGAKSYFTFPPRMLIPRDQSSNVTAIVDPFGHSYGYSTAYQANQTTGYNPTCDLWSTGSAVSNANPPDQSKWIKNW